MTDDSSHSVQALTSLLQQQLQTSAEREERMTQLFQQALASASSGMVQTQQQVQQSPQPPQPKPNTISAERPILLSSATLTDFASWREAWRDYACCQHLNLQSKNTRVSALRQAFDEDIRRFLREGIITTSSADPDSDDIIQAVAEYIRRQRNPLLDRVSYYNRKQENGESFDSFYTSLRELQAACDFPSTSLCNECNSSACGPCKALLTEASDTTLRDRIVIGVRDETTRHKLLAESKLTLADAVRVCRAEEGATVTGGVIPDASRISSMNAIRKSSYQQRKQNPRPSQSADSGKSHNASTARSSALTNTRKTDQPKCPNCGRSPHVRSPCPAAGKTCHSCQSIGHFASMCRRKSTKHSSGSSKSLGLLKLQRATSSDLKCTVSVLTQLETESTPVFLGWIPDTGSDVDAIGPQHLEKLGGSSSQLMQDHEKVCAADGHGLVSIGKVNATLSVGSAALPTTIHVYDGLTDALLSRQSLQTLGFLPQDWPRIAAMSCPDASKASTDVHTPKPTLEPTPKPTSKTTLSSKTTAEQLAHKFGPDPSSSQIAAVRDSLLEEFADVFNSEELHPMSGDPMEIQLHPDAKPFCLTTARTLPYAFRDKVKTQLDDMVAKGIIQPVTEPTEWCHPIVAVAKKGTDEVRLTVDLSKLNKQVARPAHPTRTPQDVIANIDEAQYFTKLDARHGYWQVPLSEASRPMTTFITPWGRYQFLRNPQGLISAGDVFNQRLDQAFGDVSQFAKVVDDGLIYTASFMSQVSTTREVLQKAREHGITLSRPKFEFAMSEVKFCGYVISRSGWTLDPSKTAAIADFPEPANRTDLRSFLGLVNQCSEFNESLAQLASPLRGLLKASNEFIWLPDHSAAMDDLKNALLKPPTLGFFDPKAPTRLECDASRTKGLGFGLWQLQDNNWRLIQCGSRFVTDTESRYAMIELEMLGVAWSIRKCHTYLAGLPFQLIVDHQPLVPILNTYTLNQVENPRLQRLMLKVYAYQFTTSWQKGSQHAFADALSRAPVADPSPCDELGEDPVHGLSVRLCLQQDDGSSRVLTTNFHEIHKAACADSEYQELYSLIQDGFPKSKHQLSPSLKQYWNGHEHFSTDNGIILRGSRLLIPKSLRQRVLVDLHSSHQGMERTKRRARQIVFWPSINNDIATTVSACTSCREYLPSQPKEPLLREPKPSLPFEHASADLFSCQGWEFLVFTDRLSGWPCVARLGRSSSSRDVICQLRKWFPDVGVPSRLVTDGGPQFSSVRFAQFCERWNVEHRQSSPHYRLAESAVKAVKHLILKTTRNGDLDTDEFQRGLLEWRNTPRASGKSPAQSLFGHPLQSFVYAHRRSFAPEWQAQADNIDTVSDAADTYYNATAHPLPALRIGDHVDIQHHQTKRWSLRGVIVAIGSRRDYYVKMPSGRVLWRNRRFLRKYIPLTTSSPSVRSSQPTSISASVPHVPRRSGRQRNSPRRLNISSTAGQSYD